MFRHDFDGRRGHKSETFCLSKQVLIERYDNFLNCVCMHVFVHACFRFTTSFYFIVFSDVFVDKSSAYV